MTTSMVIVFQFCRRIHFLGLYCVWTQLKHFLVEMKIWKILNIFCIISMTENFSYVPFVRKYFLKSSWNQKKWKLQIISDFPVPGYFCQKTIFEPSRVLWSLCTKWRLDL